MPISLTITRYHWLLLYPDRVVGISRETEQAVWDEALPLVSRSSVPGATELTLQHGDERAISLSADPVSKTFWIATDRSILEVLVQNEDRDVWRARLEKGNFSEALRFAKVRLTIALVHTGLLMCADEAAERRRSLSPRRRPVRTGPLHTGSPVLCEVQPLIRIRRFAVHRRRRA